MRSIAVFAVGTALLLAGAAQASWKMLDPLDADLIVAGDRLGLDPAAVMFDQSPDYRTSTELHRWARGGTVLEVYLATLQPGMGWTGAHDVQDVATGQRWLGGTISGWGDLEVANTSIGKIQFRRFWSSTKQCIGWNVPFRSGEGARAAHEAILSGMYCEQGSAPISPDQAGKVLSSIRTKK